MFLPVNRNSKFDSFMEAPCSLFLKGVFMSAVFFDDEADIPDLRYDIVFKAVFTRENQRSREALNGLLSACIGRRVSVLNLNANEPSPSSAWDKQIRFDIACRLESGELAEVEMTLHPSPSEPFREEYFVARLFVSQDIRGSREEYRELRNVYQINILANGIRYKDEELVHCFRFHDTEHDLSFKGRMHIITIELAKAEKLAREKAADVMGAAEAWAVFLRYHTEKAKRALVNEILRQREDIAMAGENALAFSKEELEYFRETSRLKYELDMNDLKARTRREGREEGRAEGRVEGHAEGRAEGRAEGIAEGHAEGRAEGRAEGKLESARKMKEAGLTADQIQMFTGLTPEEIEKL